MHYNPEDISYTIESVGNYSRHFINGVIRNTQVISDLIKRLRSCHHNDVVHIYINSEGGDVYTCMQIINAIKECNGQVITQADGNVSSAASLIFFSANVLYVSDFSTFLIHNGSMFVGGKHSDTLLQTSALKNMIEHLFKEVYIPFLSDEEVNSVLSGRDMHLTSEQVCSRIKKVVEKEQEDENTIQQKPKERNRKSKRVSKTK